MVKGTFIDRSISELDRFCIMNDHILIVKHGLLIGVIKDYDR